MLMLYVSIAGLVILAIGGILYMFEERGEICSVGTVEKRSHLIANSAVDVEPLWLQRPQPLPDQ